MADEPTGLLIQSFALGLPVPVVVALAAALPASLAGTVRRARTVQNAFVPRALITDSTFVRAAVTGIGVYAGLFAAMYAVPQILVRDSGWSVLAVGGRMLPGAVAGAVLSRVAGRLTAGPGGSRLLAVVALATAGALAASLAGPARRSSSSGPHWGSPPSR
ncbi:hypothetical protein [Streptomyces sp. NPDC014894]|uniref:hypothetical protein n=1 Tax=Streptomyces sp. NPDC014894 TaxID=3364931 RepID=UPI0036F8A14C